MTRPKKSTKKPKQRELPIKGKGAERVVNKAIESAADKYVDIRDERMELSKKESAAHAGLLALMHEHKLTVYKYNGRTIEVQPSEKVRVKTAKSEETATVE